MSKKSRRRNKILLGAAALFGASKLGLLGGKTQITGAVGKDKRLFTDIAKKGVAPQIFTYTTTDTVATLNTSGYFNDVSTEVAVGDVIISVTSTGGTLASSIHTVVSNASDVVDVSDGTTIAQTDSD